MRKTVLFASVAALLLGGCAARGPVLYPAYKTVPTVAVSATALSTATETPAGDYLIDNSQVFVRGAQVSQGASAFGLIGAVLAISAANRSNAAAVADVASKLSVKFDKDLNEALDRTVSQEPFNGKVKLQLADTPADLLLLPYVILQTSPDNQVRLIFQVASRFTTADNTRQRKTYAYVSPGVGTPASWTDNGNARLNQSARVAFDRLAAAVLNDLAGKYKEPLTTEKPVIDIGPADASGAAPKALLLEEAAGYRVAVPMFRDRPIPGLVQLFDTLPVKEAAR